MQEDPPQTTAIQRVRRVIARELTAERPPEVIGEPVERVATAFDAPIGEVLKSPEAPVVDPTHYGKRRRRRSHVRQYQLAQVLIALGMMSAAGGIICVLLGERQAGQIVAFSGLGISLIAMVLAWRTRLTGRVLGYAVAAVVLTALSTGASTLLPPAWFEDPHPEENDRSLRPANRAKPAAVPKSE